jgi:uncharacterized protein
MSVTPEILPAQSVAEFLRHNPDFFLQNADVLATINIPSAHGGRAISLHERQLEVLREKNRALELRMADLMRNGKENDAILDKIQNWTRQLLLQADRATVPDVVVNGMSQQFAVPQVALRVWSVRNDYRQLPCAAPVDVDIVRYADSLSRPYCGAGAEMAARAWLGEAGALTKSLALLPLRKGADPKSFGLLLLGSPDADRFRTGMGTAFLERIAELSSAALSHLVQPALISQV